MGKFPMYSNNNKKESCFSLGLAAVWDVLGIVAVIAQGIISTTETTAQT